VESSANSMPILLLLLHAFFALQMLSWSLDTINGAHRLTRFMLAPRTLPPPPSPPSRSSACTRTIRHSMLAPGGRPSLLRPRLPAAPLHVLAQTYHLLGTHQKNKYKQSMFAPGGRKKSLRGRDGNSSILGCRSARTEALSNRRRW